MIVGIRLPGATTVTEIGRGVTLLRDLDLDERHQLAAALVASLRGDDRSDVELEVELDGFRQRLTSDLARQLSLGGVAGAVVVFGSDLPGARTVDEPAAPAGEPVVDPGEAEANLSELRAELVEAQRVASAADGALVAAKQGLDEGAPAALAAAEAQLVEARSAVGDAERALEEAERAAAGVEVEHNETASSLASLRAERARLETERADILARLAEFKDPGDPAAVEAALVALRSLRHVEAEPSAEALDLADRWAEVSARLAALPQPPQPPEWLVIPALAALHEARAALAEAEKELDPGPVDAKMIDHLERAHREVLEAEQRVMKKGSRTNRRRLDAAYAAEKAALAAVGVANYGDYLRGGVAGTEAPDARLAAARAALRDAEAVWEELHGGQASPEWTAAKQAQASIRQEAHQLVGGDVDDDGLEDRLRNHFDDVVETDRAEKQLAEALQNVDVDAGDDPEVAAERWLQESPLLREAHRRLEAQLSDTDGRMAAVDEQLAETKADAFFGETDGPSPASVARLPDPEILARALREANDAVRQATTAVASATERLAASERQAEAIPALEIGADRARRRSDELAARMSEAESELTNIRSEPTANTTPASAFAPSAGAVAYEADRKVDLSGVVGMEAEAYLLARVAALRGATAGPLPLVIDAAAVAGLKDAAARRVLRLLGRLGTSMQILILGDDEKISTWAEGVDDQAPVRAVAR